MTFAARAASVALLTLLALALSPRPGAAAPVETDSTAPAADDELSRLSGRLGERLDRRLKNACLVSARVGLVVRDAATGRTLHDRGGSELLVPASNQKLLTAGALLSLLGPEKVLWTRFLAAAKPDDAGDVGDLFVEGGGDPALTPEALHGAARALAAAGVRRVGDVVVDESRLGGPPRPLSWPERFHSRWYGAPSGALSANFNVVAVHARGTGNGQPAEVWVEPFPAFFELDNQMVTGKGAWSVTSELITDENGESRQRLVLIGRVPAGRTVRELRAVEDPALFAGHAITDSLRRLGIRVEGRVRRGFAPTASVLLHSHASKPLALLVHDMNKESSNVFAEMLLRVLAAETLGPPGTRDLGLEIVRRWLASISPDAARVRLLDGSGLSAENQVTAKLLTDVLLAMQRDPLVGPEFTVALPVGNVDGTLRRRLGPTEGRRLVRAKTGRLANVVAMSGYAPVEAGRPAVFSVLVNDYHCPTWKVQDAVDALLGDIVADVPRAPEPDQRLALDDLRQAQATARAAAGDTRSGQEEDEELAGGD